MALGHEKLNKGAFNYVQRLVQLLTGRPCGDETFIEMLEWRFWATSYRDDLVLDEVQPNQGWSFCFLEMAMNSILHHPS